MSQDQRTSRRRGRGGGRVPLDRARLRRLRMEAGLSAKEFGRRAGISQGLISKIERGRVGVSPEVAGEFAEILKVSISALLLAEDDIDQADHHLEADDEPVAAP